MIKTEYGNFKNWNYLYYYMISNNIFFIDIHTKNKITSTTIYGVQHTAYKEKKKEIDDLLKSKPIKRIVLKIINDEAKALIIFEDGQELEIDYEMIVERLEG